MIVHDTVLYGFRHIVLENSFNLKKIMSLALDFWTNGKLIYCFRACTMTLISKKYTVREVCVSDKTMNNLKPSQKNIFADIIPILGILYYTLQLDLFGVKARKQ